MLKEEHEHPLRLFNYCPICGSSKFIINNIKSKCCNDCGFIYYFNPSSATVAVIVNEKKEILVATRAHEPAKGTFDLPGGFVDMYETAEQAVSREVKEKTSLNIKSLKYLFSLPNTYMYSGFEVQTTDLFFLCEIEDSSSYSAHDDVESLQFIPIEELNPKKFGLESVRKGVEKIKKMNL